MEKQINMFELLGDTSTPLIPFEEQKKGRKGWVIEISGIFLIKNGFKENMIGVCTHAIQFKEDSTRDKYGRISQYADKIHPNDGGWWGPCYDVYSKRPTLDECIAYGKKKYVFPEKIIYYERDGNWNGIYEYENGNTRL